MISKVKGGFQVREMVESSAMALRSPTAESRPTYEICIIAKQEVRQVIVLQCHSRLYVHLYVGNNALFMT